MKVKQEIAPATQFFNEDAFGKEENTVLRWLGGGGAFINSRGTCIMIDPLLKGFDMPIVIDMPIKTEQVPHLDGILVTHCDNDHYSEPTLQDLKGVCNEVHTTHYVADLMKTEKIDGKGHDIGDTFCIDHVKIKLTPADHAWQNEKPKYKREFQIEDYCGFWLDTPDGSIWMPGDSRLLPEHLLMPAADAIFLDFSDNEWHIGLEGAVKLANTYPDAQLILIHWGTVDAPEWSTFNGDPHKLKGLVKNPDRVHIFAAGEPLVLKR